METMLNILLLIGCGACVSIGVITILAVYAFLKDLFTNEQEQESI